MNIFRLLYNWIASSHRASKDFNFELRQFRKYLAARRAGEIPGIPAAKRYKRALAEGGKENT